MEQHLSRIQQVIDTLEAERAELQERLAWVEEQIKQFHATTTAQRRQRQLARGAAPPLGARALVVQPRAPARLTPRRASSSSWASIPGARLARWRRA
jgi:hypothetical protein